MDKVIACQLDRVKACAEAKPLGLLKDEWERRGFAHKPSIPNRFRSALQQPGMSLIAEIKRASPSRGIMATDLSARDQAKLYEKAGTRAVSVLTEEKYFRGSLADLSEVAASIDLPVLHKDFIVSPYQLWEGALAGATAVLLIVRVLGDSLPKLVKECQQIGLEPLVEVHHAGELEIAQGSGARIIGVNCRDLDTLTIDPTIHRRLRPMMPAGVLAVAESGIRTREDVRALEELDYAGILVGESLVTAADPAARVADLLGGIRPSLTSEQMNVPAQNGPVSGGVVNGLD